MPPKEFVVRNGLFLTTNATNCQRGMTVVFEKCDKIRFYTIQCVICLFEMAKKFSPQFRVLAMIEKAYSQRFVLFNSHRNIRREYLEQTSSAV